MYRGNKQKSRNTHLCSFMRGNDDDDHDDDNNSNGVLSAGIAEQGGQNVSKNTKKY